MDDPHRLGYQRVDDDPNADVLLATMDGTAGWDATHRLRSWERAQLHLAQGQRLLDVGCGLGEASLDLAEDLGERGELVGIDASESMLRVARSNARGARFQVRFSVGDACSLDEPDASFDAARSERTLQWLADPAAAVAEMVRVVRPGGRVSLIDTDWSTFADRCRRRRTRCPGTRLDANRAQSTLQRRPSPARPGERRLVVFHSRAPKRRRPGQPGTRTSRRLRSGASPWRASPMTSSPAIS